MSVGNISADHRSLTFFFLNPDGPQGSSGGPKGLGSVAALIQNQAQCFPSLAGRGAGATITTCAAITHSAPTAPWETWKKAAAPQPHRSLAYFHDRDRAQDVHIWSQL